MEPQPSLDLWADVQQVLQFPFMQNAVLAGTMVAVMAGLIGYFVVLRGQSFAGHTLSQVGFPGAAGAALVGAPPLAGLLVFCTAAAVAIAAMSHPRSLLRRSESAAIGTLLAFVLALGFLFSTLSRGNLQAVYSYLFGTFIGISSAQVMVLGAVMVGVLIALMTIGPRLFFVSIDPDVAAARGASPWRLGAVFLMMLGCAVAASALIVGTLLVFALLVAPAAAAQQWTTRPAWGLFLSVVIAVLVTWLGMGVAYFTIYPVGFFVTSLSLLSYLAARGARRLRSPGLRRAVV